MAVPFVEACMKVSTEALKLDCCMLVGTLLQSQMDNGDKLGCTILSAGGGVALQIYCCMSEENCCCMASGNSAMLKE